MLAVVLDAAIAIAAAISGLAQPSNAILFALTLAAGSAGLWAVLQERR